MKTMTGDGQGKAKPPVIRSILVVLLATAAILMVPLLGVQFGEVNWTLFDFVAAGVLLAGTGLSYVLASRLVRTARQRTLIGVALALALVVVWVELAVGIFD
ncbi:MAG: hypothetical protein ACXW24_01670 [Telluria sp.]